jgi:carboxypeptidase D
LDRNKGSVLHTWNLKGILIGNGWISPIEQYMSYVPFAYEAGLIERGSSTAQTLEEYQSECLKILNRENGKDRVDVPECENILQKILFLTQTRGPDGQMQCVNMYDVRLRDSYPSCGANWPPDLNYVTPYLRRSEVLQALNIAGARAPGWSECNGAVGGAFRARNSKPSIAFLPDIIAEVPTVLFSGAKDLICNHLGTEDLINNMEWNGGKGFEISPGNWAPRREWTFEGELAGIYQEARNLTYVLFYNSSHMVPFDYARRTRDMLDRFMNVDIASIGGAPSDSRIDGEKGLETSVGGHPNSTAAKQEEKKKLDEASRRAYYRSGEIALVVVCIAASVWGYYVWKDRRSRAGYSGLFGGSRDGSSSNGLLGRMGVDSFRHRHQRDVEAGDFDENRLDELHITTPPEDIDRDRYSVGSVSEDEEHERRPGQRSRHNDEKTLGKP